MGLGSSGEIPPAGLPFFVPIPHGMTPPAGPIGTPTPAQAAR